MPLIIVLFVVVFIVVAVLGAQAAKKRREAMAVLAAKLDLHYTAEKDYQLDNRYSFLDKLRQGSNRYAYNMISGSYEGHTVMVFDYHYETHSTDSKGRRQTHHHHFSFFILTLPKSFPELTIGKEHFFSKIAQAIGFDDIDFESHEFSRKFTVRSKDKKFAYDFCNARMIEYLLANPDLGIEVDQSALAIGFPSRLKAEQIEYNLKRMIHVRSLMPDYLFDS
ncbi:MAG: DUF3137 domain-containing protein [Kiritimatiellales bacterium]|nr:DUF3137 domain-containing protein [Kiritimatiellales bacterium]